LRTPGARRAHNVAQNQRAQHQPDATTQHAATPTPSKSENNRGDGSTSKISTPCHFWARQLIMYHRQHNLRQGVWNMLLHSLMALTDNRKRMVILTLLTFAVLC
jgi:hypothetical protein